MDGETALLVAPSDAAALSVALRRLVDDDELLHRLSAGGRRVYQERASEAVLGARWRELLEHVTGQTGIV